MTMEKNNEKKQVLDLAAIDPKNLPELSGWKEKQLQAVKDNPFVQITDNETYESAKKNRTALVTCRTTLQKQDKAVASKLKELRTNVGNVTQELIEITLPHENKQQEEVKRYEAILEQKRIEREEKERKRIEGIQQKIQDFKDFVSTKKSEMAFGTIDESINVCEKLYEEYKQDFDFEEFLPLFETAYSEAMISLNEKANELREKEKQRLENERLAKEAEQARKRSELQQKRLEELLPYNQYGADVDMSTLWALSEDAYKKVFSDKKSSYDYAMAEKARQEAAEEERQRKIKEQKA